MDGYPLPKRDGIYKSVFLSTVCRITSTSSSSIPLTYAPLTSNFLLLYPLPFYHSQSRDIARPVLLVRLPELTVRVLGMLMNVRQDYQEYFHHQWSIRGICKDNHVYRLSMYQYQCQYQHHQKWHSVSTVRSWRRRRIRKSKKGR